MLEVKFDPTIQMPEIQMPMYSAQQDPDFAISSDNIQQTKIDGILTPLIRINNQTVFYTEIRKLELTCKHYPELYCIIEDQLGTIKDLDIPGYDNSLQLQILPSFDGAYKKINLLFYITSLDIRDNLLYISASYHIPNIWNQRMKASGQISTYEYMEQTAKEFGLGFCSNISSTPDVHYIYNPMLTPLEHINQTIQYAHDDNKYSTYDWWIDYWNNLNFVNIYNEYQEKLPDDKMQIWTTDKFQHGTVDDNAGEEPVQSIAALTNHPLFISSQLYITDYSPSYDSPGVADQIFDVWSMEEQSQQTTIIENGDANDNLFRKYVYGGEVFGDYDYLSREACKSLYASKIGAKIITTSITKPTFGLYKGKKANVWWYDQGNYVTQNIQLDSNEEMKSNTELPDSLQIGESPWIINKMISGQYYINSVSYIYNGGFEWEQVFELSRDSIEQESYNPVQLSPSEKN